MKPIDPEKLPMARFWSRVTDAPSGCLEWTGALSNKGYGTIVVGNKTVYAHRVAWAIAHGRDPGDGCVLHTCDNPKCVRDSHLYLGTLKDNVQDCLRRGRHRNGRPGHRMARQGSPQ